MFKGVLTLYDGSIVTKKALNIGLSISRSFGSKCYALRTGQQEKPAFAVFKKEASREIAFTDKDFASAKFLAAQEGVDLYTKEAWGNTWQSIKNIANQEDVDLIIITPATLSKYGEKPLRGSIVSLLKNTRASVLLVK